MPFAPKHGTGALTDPRPQEEKDKDYLSKEVALASAINWTTKPQSLWRRFEIFDQDGSSSCVAQAVSKLLGVENALEEGRFLRFSARDIYTRRSNFPSEGMWFQEALDIASKHGATFENLMTSEKKNESQMNVSSDRTKSDQQIAQIFKGGGYVSFEEPYNIDEIASAISKGKAVLMGFRFDFDEWTNRPVALVANPSLHHGVAAVDFTLDRGEKCLVIDDSWGGATAMQGQRLITENFMKRRCTYAGYLLDLSNNWRDTQSTISRPHANFQIDLVFNMTHPDIKKLQDVLKYEELFPVNQESTGYYGNLTAKGVLAWQKRYAVATTYELDKLGGKTFGPQSRVKANTLYQ